MQSIFEKDECEMNEEEDEAVNGESCPPSPPPRPKHTLSQQSFALLEHGRADTVANDDGQRESVDGNERAPPPVAHNSSSGSSSKRKSSWRKHRTAVSKLLKH